MSFPSSKFRVFLMVTALLVGLASTSCSSYIIKNLTSQPVRVILQTADGTQADIVNAGDTWATWSTDDSAYSVTVKNAKLYMDQFDKLNGEFEAIKNQPGCLRRSVRQRSRISSRTSLSGFSRWRPSANAPRSPARSASGWSRLNQTMSPAPLMMISPKDSRAKTLPPDATCWGWRGAL